MRTVHQWLNEYGESHQNLTNKRIHWLCVPLIMVSVVGLLWDSTQDFLPLTPMGEYFNGATILLFLALLYYIRLSIPLFIGMIPVTFLLIKSVDILKLSSLALWQTSLIIFTLAWIGQFIGHKIEGKKPSFVKDLQFLLIGPLWLLSHWYRKMEWEY